MNALYAFLWIFALWKWGDWRNWKIYYPTMLFFILGDFLYLYLLSDIYPMWTYDPQGIDEKANLTNTHVSLSIIAVKYPATILIYLYRFPAGNLIKKLLYISGWVLLYTVNEIVDIKLKLIKYDNGWNLKWSILFNAVMFIILWVHFKRPAAAWELSILFFIFLWRQFDVPSTVFR
ncbi:MULTISPECIES: CBO0543 family protein [unclassified Cytobacillus]|uniref:CBO0543 family protein n=1 Tax=unclassified Cytobacillus TaxID=2675268 RepID=UPI00203D0764|nr:CBO0543 family protein [Cytobacillus sp. AMY 15.2]MCM3093890.1 hypothetical protein [Cytobacillus sp. AMY 15.2]